MFVQEKKSFQRKESTFQFSSSHFNILAHFNFFISQPEPGQQGSSQRTAKGLILKPLYSAWQTTSAEQPWPFVRPAFSLSSRLLFRWKGLGTLRTYAEGSLASQSECGWRTKPVDWWAYPLILPPPQHHNWLDWHGPNILLFWHDRQTLRIITVKDIWSFTPVRTWNWTAELFLLQQSFEFCTRRVHGFRHCVFSVFVFLMSGVRTIKSFSTHRPVLCAALRLQEVGEKRQI